jgi:adenylate kinase family enzyme
MIHDTYIFISRSGGGKGTQIALLEEHIKDNSMGEVFHLEAGDEFREFISGNTYSSNLAKEINDKGELQPAFLAVWAWSNEFIKNLKKEHILMIDGTPRKLIEAKLLEEALDFYGREKIKIVFINVSREWAIERMKERKRKDDKSFESIAKRLDWFDDQVLPVLDYFKKNDNYEILEINGEQTIGAVHREIIEKLGL